MITILHPGLMPIIKEIPMGLMPVRISEEESPCLIIKVPKEYILTAKINENLKIYLAPVIIENQHTVCAVTAFFDDDDEPLVLTTPLFNDVVSREFFELLKSKQVKIHFFDELSRERLVYEATIKIPESTKRQIRELTLVESSLPKAKAMLDEALNWFGRRTSEHDAVAIDISLDGSVYGEDLFIQDMRLEEHSYHGSRGHSHTVLEIEEPGNYQEEDIIKCLLSVFSAEQIFLSPKRTYDREEICDILVITDNRVLVIQAKDSPNVERISRQKLTRKRSNVMNALNKAVNQVKGAIGYCRREINTLHFFINEKQYSFDIRTRDINTLIVVKELFNDQYGEYSQILLDLVRKKKVPCVALDYPELYKYCAHLSGEDSFFKAYNTVMEHAIKNNEYPRLRFGLVAPNQQM